MEGAPRDLEVNDVGRALIAHPQVLGIHDLHVWSLSRSLRFLSVHIEVEDVPVSQTEAIRHALSELVSARFRIRHATFQFESEPVCHRRLFCDIARVPDPPVPKPQKTGPSPSCD